MIVTPGRKHEVIVSGERLVTFLGYHLVWVHKGPFQGKQLLWIQRLDPVRSSLTDLK